MRRLVLRLQVAGAIVWLAWASALADGTQGPANNRVSRGSKGIGSNVTSDGANPVFNSTVTPPATPSGQSQNTFWFYAPDAGFPGLAMETNSLLMTPIPEGAAGAVFTHLDATANWLCQYHVPDSWSATVAYRDIGGPALSQTAGSNNTIAWSPASFYGRMRSVGIASAAAINSTAGMRTAFAHAWMGNAANAGGFWLWARLKLNTVTATSRFAIGLFNQLTVIGTATDPSAQTDCVYYGCNSGDANISICSNDNSGTATCNTLGSNFPCTTNGAIYDFWLAAGANATAINWYITRLDTPASLAGQISADLPRNSVQMGYQAWLNSGPSSAASVRMDYAGAAWCDNW